MNQSVSRSDFLKIYRRQLNKELRQMGYGQLRAKDFTGSPETKH